MKNNWKKEKSNLEKYILTDKLSYEEIGRIYGCTGAAVKKAAKRLGIELQQRRTINENETFNKGTAKTKTCKYCGKKYVAYLSNCGDFCCHECQHEYIYSEFIRKWLNGEETGNTVCFRPSKHIRRYLFELYNNKCEKCGWGEKNEYTGKVPLQIHHVNGDSNDNRVENLQLLCPNCHSLTKNFMGGNKNATKGRSHYYDRKRDRAK